jgi:hypothetical protein
MCRCIWGCVFRIICGFEVASGWHKRDRHSSRTVILRPRRKNNSPQRHGAHREHNNVDLFEDALTTTGLNLIASAKRGTPIGGLITTQNYLLSALGGSVVNILAWFDHLNRRLVIITQQ